MALGARFSGVLESARMGEEWAFTVLYRDLHISSVEELAANPDAWQPH